MELQKFLKNECNGSFLIKNITNLLLIQKLSLLLPSKNKVHGKSMRAYGQETYYR